MFFLINCKTFFFIEILLIRVQTFWFLYKVKVIKKKKTLNKTTIKVTSEKVYSSYLFIIIINYYETDITEFYRKDIVVDKMKNISNHIGFKIK